MEIDPQFNNRLLTGFPDRLSIIIDYSYLALEPPLTDFQRYFPSQDPVQNLKVDWKVKRRACFVPSNITPGYIWPKNNTIIPE